MAMLPKIQCFQTDSCPLLIEYEVVSVGKGGVKPRMVQVCREERVHLEVNGTLIASLNISPCELAEFACGYCITEGLVPGISGIRKVDISGDHVNVFAPALEEDALARPSEIRTSGCVGIIQGNDSFMTPLSGDTRVSRSVIYSAMERLNDHAVLWRGTGGTHCTVLYNSKGNAVSHAEDIGRHNSVDKAIGKALLTGIDPAETFICSSGRMPEGMVSKIYRAKIPIVVTNNAPSAAGIDLARRVKLTLAGFVRPPRMNIYSVPERIILD